MIDLTTGINDQLPVVEIDGVEYTDCPHSKHDLCRRDWHRCEDYNEFWPGSVIIAVAVFEFSIERKHGGDVAATMYGHLSDVYKTLQEIFLWAKGENVYNDWRTWMTSWTRSGAIHIVDRLEVLA